MATVTGMIRRITTEPIYIHLSHLSDDRGVFEHAQGDQPRRQHGYCVDDVARALIVAVREPSQSLELGGLAGLYLHFLEAAIEPDGKSHNRMNERGQWTDSSGSGDWWGRSLWALGVAAVEAPMADTRATALSSFLELARNRSLNVRSMAFACLGASALISSGNIDPLVRSLLDDALAIVPSSPTRAWGWPEARLRYANGTVAEAIIAAGEATADARLTRRGLAMLDVLVKLEARDGHLSVTGADGRGPEDLQAQFDQQPIEVAAIADASVRAYEATGSEHWLDVLGMSWNWFLGDNDSGVAMIDELTGAGFDGLERHGRNDNRGAESTLAALGTWQHAHRYMLAERP